MRIHYHIIRTDRVDWERFDSREEAESVAKKLRHDENYRIEEFEDDTCTRCRLRRES